jgi:hypothetical protein
MSQATPQPGPAGPRERRAEVPSKVASAAAGKQIGNLLAGICIAAVIIGFAYLLAWAAVVGQLRRLGVWSCCLAVGAVVVLGFSVAALLAGSTATYLYANGIVGVRNFTVQAVSWPEVDELWLWRSVDGVLLRYYVVTFDGRRIPVFTSDKSGDKTLAEQLQRIVRQLDRPVKDSGPFTRDRHR